MFWFFKGKGGVGGGRKIDNEEMVEIREGKVFFSDKDIVIVNVNLSFLKWKKMSGKFVKVKEKEDVGNVDVEVNINIEKEYVNELVMNDENLNDIMKIGVIENE